MDKPKQILMLGANSDTILLPLGEMIRKASTRFELSVSGLLILRTKKVLVSDKGCGSFVNCLPAFGVLKIADSIRPGGVKKSPHVLTSLLANRVGKGWKMRLVGRIQREKFRKDFGSRVHEFDLLHIHGMFLSGLHYWLVNSNKCPPFIVSCWGSDVLRNSDIEMIKVQQKLLRKASVITVSGPEFKEVVLSKYGRDLAPKIHFAIFDPELESIPFAERAPAAASFREKFNVGSNQKIVAIAHNGHPNNNHLELIESLSELSTHERGNFFCVLQMTYAVTSEYIDKVQRALDHAELKGVILTEFMSHEDLLELRLATDVLIYAPISDAFSASVTQALAAGTVVVLGSWLPYKVRTRAGFHYTEIDSTTEAGSALKRILVDWEQEKSFALPNRVLSSQFFNRERLGQAWCAAYEAALKDSPN